MSERIHHKSQLSLKLVKKIPPPTEPKPVRIQERNVRPSAIQKLVNEHHTNNDQDKKLGSDENEEKTVGEDRPSILKRNCGRIGWQTANI